MQWGPEKPGIEKELARQTAYTGDLYQSAVTKTCAVRTVSDEKLKQAGLISCYDYYMERHTFGTTYFEVMFNRRMPNGMYGSAGDISNFPARLGLRHARLFLVEAERNFAAKRIQFSENDNHYP